MTYIAIKVPVIESERGWGSKIDDHMVCISVEEAKKFIKEFNSKNTEPTTPDWYMQAEDNFSPITLTEEQYKRLMEEKKIWLSQLK